MRIALLFGFVFASTAAAQGFGPFGSRHHPVTSEVKRPAAMIARAAPASLHLDLPALKLDPPPPPSTFLWLAYEFYRTALSPIDGPRCTHRPTCSRYALQAVQRHPVVGLWLAVDRLWRGNDSSALRRLPLVRHGEGFYFLDPLEESDFWFRSH